MTNEEKLIDLIRTHSDTEQALIVAVGVILNYLKKEQPLSFQEQEPVAPVEHA